MKKYFNLLVGVIALLCFISLYMPLIGPKYPAAEYTYTTAAAKDYALSGDYYWAREYWSISRFLFSSTSALPRIILCLTQVSLIYWAWLASRGEGGKIGIITAVVNLIVVTVTVVLMLRVRGSVRWEVLIMVALDSIAAVVLAVLHSTMKDPPKYITRGVSIKKQ